MTMQGNKGLHVVSFVLLIIGGLNWLIQGVFMWDIGQLFGGMGSIITRIIYVLVGLAALYILATHKSYCKFCANKPQI